MEWMTAPPHALHQVIGIYAEVLAGKSMRWRHGTTSTEIIADLAAARYDGGRGGTGGHADPTANAALRHEPDADDQDETIGQMRHSEELLYELSWTLADHVGANTDCQWTGLHGAKILSSRCLPLLSEDDHTARSIIVDICDTASWLHEKARWIWDASKGEALPVAEQKPLVECRICGTWRKGTIAVAAGRCAECDNFHRNHPDCERTEPIVRRAEYGKGPTPAQMIEARAAGKGKKRKTVTA
jgi:hypothetical protein